LGLFFVILFLSNFLQAQDSYDQLKTQYDRLRKEAKHDSALVVAKHDFKEGQWYAKNDIRLNNSVIDSWKPSFFMGIGMHF
jgi:hypothetical protein